MLFATVLSLAPTETSTLPAHLGRATHGWFLQQIQGLDADLAQQLHAPNQDRPFTVSDVWGPGIRRRGQNIFHPEKNYNLRLTSVHPTLSALLADRLLPRLPEAMELAGGRFQIAAATTDTEENPWAGHIRYELLAQEQMLAQKPPRQISLRFASPTVFRSNDAWLPLPLPRLVFEGLARRWNAFSPIQIHPDLPTFAEECLLLSRYHLQTELVDRGTSGRFPGFVGTVTYASRNRDRYWMGLIHLLAHFAFFIGVGRQTAMGLGQVRVMSNE